MCLWVNVCYVLVFDEGFGKVVLSKDVDMVVLIVLFIKLMMVMVVLDVRFDLCEILCVEMEDVDILKYSVLWLCVGVELLWFDVLKFVLMNFENCVVVVFVCIFLGGLKGFDLVV